MDLDRLEADVRDLAQDITPGEGIQHPWVLRSAAFGRRAIWELRRSSTSMLVQQYGDAPLFEGAEFKSEEEMRAASPKDWRDLVYGGCAFKEFLPHKEDGTGGPFASWEEAEAWLLAAVAQEVKADS